MSELNYEQDIKIDADSLDTEWLEQAELMRKYGKHLARTERDMDNAKERLEAGKARIEMDIRNNPEKYDLSKVTEGAISSTIALQDDYRELIKKYNEAKYEYGVAYAAVQAMHQRKKALENLVQLLNMSYFAGPKAPRDLSAEQLNQTERKRQNSKVKIQQRKKEGGQ